jgi:16S rRNA (guanine(966)-N(2))-methyltransferase RsmD
MRVTGGELRGRRIPAQSAGVRPTQDRVREALFSILGARVAGASFLDLFAGSGAVGIEAWSRGAARVCWVESGRRVLPGLRQNVALLCGGAGRVVGADVFAALGRGAAGEGFDIVFADPPYGLLGGRRGGGPRGRDLLAALLAGGGVLAAGGLVILEQAADEPLPGGAGWDLTDRRVYGDTRLAFFVLRQGRA